MPNQKQVEKYIKQRLSKDTRWATRALVRIYEHQTEDEKVNETTRHMNGVGFNGRDADFLTSLAKQLESRGSLSLKQMSFVHKMMPKYWKQILHISDEEKLHKLILINTH